MQRVGVAVPAVELAGDADLAGVGRPDHEAGPWFGGGALVGAEDVPEELVPTFTDEVEVDLSERGLRRAALCGRHLSESSEYGMMRG
ncbi:hypothetical protein NSI01_40880 [Pimelobacter simplex]|nr:hypothetical protein NSI01_40880 [Pimelobacter simplex]